MNKRKILTTCLLFLIIISSYGQLSGYYTIGGTSANYQTLALGLTDLYSQGINGDVTFALNPGTHSGTTFTEIPGASDSCRFTLQSATLDSTDVNFNQPINIFEASHITIRAITITSMNHQSINSSRSKDIHIENCRINSYYDGGFYEGAIDVDHFSSGPNSSDITINQCFISSKKACIVCSGDQGVTAITDCELNSLEYVSVRIINSNHINIYNSILNGGINTRLYHDFKLVNNTITGMIDCSMVDSVINNLFISDEYFTISSKYYRDNIFEVLHVNHPFATTSKYINNYFEGTLTIGHATDIVMDGNIFREYVHLSFNKKLLFTNNTVYKEFYYGDTYTGNWNYRIYNNLIIGGYILAGGHNSIISYNNFVDSAYLYIDYGDIMAFDNNFCQGIRGVPLPVNVYHNNYFPLIYCYYDTASVHYDPCYTTDNIGIATNPLLQGKGWSQTPSQDYLGSQRKTPPAIGANEIYICSDSSNNNITVPCGEELFLNLCSVPDTGSFWWTPDSCVLHHDSLYTSLYAYNDLTLYLNNSVYGLIDSVIIQTEQFQVEIAEMPLVYCGYPRILNATFHPNANYHWIPEEGLSDPYIRNPSLLLEDTLNLQYVLECQVDSCSTSYDTINIDFDPLPIVGIYYPEQSFDTLFFTCLSSCVDESLWDFGDGTFSNEENPSHIYQENGTYIITLTGTNEYGSRSHTVSFDFYYVSTPDYKINERIKIYPNPANSEITIKGLKKTIKTEIKVVDLSGTEVLRSNVISDHAVLNIQDMKEGLYIIFIMTENETIIEKIVVIH